MPISAAEMTAKSKKKKEIVQQIEQEMPEASDEEKKAEIAKRLEKAMENYTPRTKENPSTGRTRSRLEIRMGYEQKPCNPAQVLSEEIVPYVAHKTSVPYRLEPTIEYPDDMSVESDQILDSADDPDQPGGKKLQGVLWDNVWHYESRYKETACVPQPSKEMQLWQAYRNAYEEKARKNEYKLQKRITSLEQQLVQLQDKYLPSVWSCADPYIEKIEEQNKIIDELKKEIDRLHKLMGLQLKNVEFDPPRMLAIEPMQAEPNHHE
jgi:hypothetical protein